MDAGRSSKKTYTASIPSGCDSAENTPNKQFAWGTHPENNRDGNSAAIISIMAAPRAILWLKKGTKRLESPAKIY